VPKKKKDSSDSKKLTPTKQRLIDTIADIAESPDEADIGYAPHALVQGALPYKETEKLKQQAQWVVENGNFGLVIQPGYDIRKKESIGYPTGAIPRLLMFWMATEAKQKKSSRLELGGTLAEFLRKLGLDASRGGKRSDAYRLKEQMKRLFRCNISFEYHDTSGNIEHEQWMDMRIAPKGEVMWSELYPTNEEGKSIPSWIELGDYFYEAITEKSVPIDMRVIKGIHDKPMALDLYNWITYRAYAAYQKNKELKVPWGSLHKQLGATYGRQRDFTKRTIPHLRTIQQLYRDLKIDVDKGGLTIHPSKPAVQAKTSVSLADKSGSARKGKERDVTPVEPQQLPPAQGELYSLDPVPWPNQFPDSTEGESEAI
jgi:hypothetical protein